MRMLVPMLLFSVLLGAADAGETLPLAGRWRVALDPGDEGMKAGWPLRNLNGGIQLPGTTDEAGLGARTQGSDYGILTRAHRFVGPVWFQREVIIPAGWKGRDLELFLERVTWESRVFVDGRECSRADSLGTPHVHSLGTLAPGRHTLTLRVDNRMIHAIGDKGHAYGDYTQSLWNGVVGRMELRARSVVGLGRVRTFPSFAGRSVAVALTIRNGGTAPAQGQLELLLRERGGRLVAHQRLPFRAEQGEATLRPTLTLTRAPKGWSEFDPALYTLETRLRSGSSRDVQRTTLGFRDLARTRHHVTFNGRPTFLRGNLDCVHFPLTGYPAMDVEAWRRIFRAYRAHGLNHARFHSWCPPEAAFQAADELGIALQVEVLWIDSWMGQKNPGRPEMDTLGMPQGVGKADRSIDDYVRAEMRRMLDTYGDHPSFVAFCIGNELGSSDFKTMDGWIRDAKAYDPRHLYAASTARTLNPSDDYCATHSLPGVGATRGTYAASTDWDFEPVYGKADIPILAHEIGQWPVYPDWTEIGRYTGVLKARNLEGFRELARKNGILAQDRELQAASGASQTLLYKHEIEGFLRTPSCGGVQLLSMQDYPGQGEALIGWLDAFWSSKGLVRPEVFRRYFGPTVPLARLPRFTFSPGETVKVGLQLAHWGPQDLKAVVLEWRLKDEGGRAVASGGLPARDVAVGSSPVLGDVSLTLPAAPRPGTYTLDVAVAGTTFCNTWKLWVFPKEAAIAAPGVTVTDRLEPALEALRRGGRVLLVANRLGTRSLQAKAAWMPLYWSASFFPGQDRETLGALVRARHPALAGFPTEGHLDWQWRPLCEGARGFVLSGLPEDYRPIVQPVSDFHFSEKLGTVFELGTAEGGRLLVSGYDVHAPRPEAAALKASLLAYAASEAFRPSQVVEEAFLRRTFPYIPEAPSAVPVGFEGASLYVQAGARHPEAKAGEDLPWTSSSDAVKAQGTGFSYRVEAEGTCREKADTAWFGRTLRVEVTTPSVNLADLYVRFHDWNRQGRRGILRFEGRTYDLGDHAQGRWIKLEVMREDQNDGRLVLEAEVASGGNLMITDLALVPK